MKRLAPLLLSVLAACAGDDPSSQTEDDTACKVWGGTFSGVTFSDGQAVAVIDMADHATLGELDAVPGIGGTTATAIFSHRPYGTQANPLAALDAVSGVGPSILTSLRDTAATLWCAANDGRQSCCGATPAASTLVVNELAPGTTGWVEIYNGGSAAVDLTGYTLDDVRGSGSKAVAFPAGTTVAPKGFVVLSFGGINVSSADQANLVDAQGKVVDSTSNFYAGASLAGKCFGRSPDGGAWSEAPVACTKGASNGGSTPPPATCAAPGGTYDSVAFTAAEECHAVDFLNNARFSEMAALPDKARLVAYEAGPEGVYAFGSSAWTKLSDFANLGGIGTTALSAVKSAAAGWTANGLPYDTVAATWTNRKALVDGPVYLDKVWVVKVLPKSGAIGNYECAEVRDAASAANYLTVCVPLVICDMTCWPKGSGTFQSMYGTLRTTTMTGTGGYRLVANALPTLPNPKVP